MAFSFGDMQSEVLRMALRNQSGGSFTIAVQNAINLSMWTIARENKWRSLRRKASFNTVTSYFNGNTAQTFINTNINAVLDTSGNTVYDSSGNIVYVNSGAVQNVYGQGATLTTGSIVFSVPGATFISDGIRLGRYIKFDGSITYFRIASITSETTGTLNLPFDGQSGTGLGYSVLPQEEYTLPIQIGHSCFLWHRKYGMPKVMDYVPSFDFYKAGVLDILTNIPVTYRMWGVDAAIQQPITPSVMTISSSVTTDTNIPITIFGNVNGYPDYEIITTNGSTATTPVSGAKLFSSVERIVKNQASTGLISVVSNLQTNTYVFNISNVTNFPALGDTYNNNSITYTITYINLTGTTGASTGTFTMTGSGAPTTSGTLTRNYSPKGDTTISFTSVAQQSILVGVLPVGLTTTGPMYSKV